MSTGSWVIEGIGIPYEKFLPHVCLDKFVAGLKRTTDKDTVEEIREEIKKEFHGSVEKFVIYGDNENDPKLMVASAMSDEHKLLSYTMNEENEGYIYYPPSMPWERKECEPQSEEEAIAYIVKAVQSISDMDEADIRAAIDNDLFIVCEA